jgi:hypothetical protein
MEVSAISTNDIFLFYLPSFSSSFFFFSAYFYLISLRSFFLGFGVLLHAGAGRFCLCLCILPEFSLFFSPFSSGGFGIELEKRMGIGTGWGLGEVEGGEGERKAVVIWLIVLI